MNTPETEIVECWTCQTPFERTRTGIYQRFSSRLCGTCTAAEIETSYRKAIADIEAKITDIMPARFRATDPAHPDFNLALWKRIQAWRPTDERPWLGLIGPTGESKTRCAFLLLREITLAMIRRSDDPDRHPWRPSIIAISAHRFAETVMAQFNDDTKTQATESLRQLRRMDIVMLDDLGKQRNTPAVSSELFAMLDHRHAENLTTIWTSNSSPEGIVSGMSEDMAAPLAGRIRECSTIINLAQS